MQIVMHDRMPLGNVKRLGDGRLAATARFARSGVYQYLGSEVGRPELGTVNIYRPESEVFSEDSMASFAHKAVTLGHPTQAVDASNWTRIAVGYTEGRIARDGAFLEIPLMVADAAAVAAVESGRAKQLSAGYSCQLVWEDGIAPTGERYQAKQIGIVGNHISLVEAGRAGPEARIGDAVMNTHDIGRQIRDAARAGRYGNGPGVIPVSATVPAPVLPSTAPMTTDHAATRALRDKIHSSRYAA